MPDALLIGDSHSVPAAGFGAALVAGLQAQGLTVNVQAESGASVRTWIGRLRTAAPPGPFALVVVALGTNDFARTPAAWAGDVATLAELVEAYAGARLVWLAAPAASVDVAWQFYLLGSVLGGRWTVVDQLPLTQDLARWPDGIHYPPASGQEWARRVLVQLTAADRERERVAAAVPTAGWIIGGAVALVGAGLAVLGLRRKRRIR